MPDPNYMYCYSYQQAREAALLCKPAVGIV